MRNQFLLAALGAASAAIVCALGACSGGTGANIGDASTDGLASEATTPDADVSKDSGGDGALAEHCRDGVKNDDESDLDCGGSVCAPCDNGKACTSSTDCASGACTASQCAAWSRNFGGPGLERLTGMVVDAAGNVYAAGLFNGAVDFGRGIVTPSAFDGFLLKLARDGRVEWVKTVGGAGDQFCVALGLAANGDVVVGAMHMGNAVDFSGATVQGAGTVLARFAASGALVWQRNHPGIYVSSLAVDATGNLLTGGAKDGNASVTVAGTTMQGHGGVYDGVAVKFSGVDGAALWATDLGAASHDVTASSQFDRTPSIGVDALGDLYVMGAFFDAQPPAIFGWTTADAGLPNSYSWDAYLARVDGSDGHVAWAKPYLGAGFLDVLDGLVVVPGGDLLVTASVSNTDFGGGPSGPGQHPVALRLPADGGVPLWENHGSVAAGQLSLGELAGPPVLDPAGRVVVAGTFTGPSLLFRGNAIVAPSNGAATGFVATFDPATGAATPKRVWGGTGVVSPWFSQVNARTSNVVVGRMFTGDVDFGAGTLAGHASDGGPAADDVFIVSLGHLP